MPNTGTFSKINLRKNRRDIFSGLCPLTISLFAYPGRRTSDIFLKLCKYFFYYFPNEYITKTQKIKSDFFFNLAKLDNMESHFLTFLVNIPNMTIILFCWFFRPQMCTKSPLLLLLPFCPNILGIWQGTVKDILPFCECILSCGDTHRWK